MKIDRQSYFLGVTAGLLLALGIDLICKGQENQEPKPVLFLLRSKEAEKE